MPLARINQKILFFAHIPKTGGSSVETYLRKKGALALKAKRRFGWSATVAQHMEAEVHSRLAPDAFVDASFAVLRDPIARLVSEYRYRQDREEWPGTFPDFVRTAFDLHARNPHALDNHIRPQVDFLRPGMVLFRLEEGLDAVFDWIDTTTQTQPGRRDLWEKRSQSATVDVSDNLRRDLTTFYASDYALLDRLNENGRVLDPAE